MTNDLRDSVGEYLRNHHVMSLATAGRGVSRSDGLIPHAASVFYAVDRDMRLIFVSKASSRHGRDVLSFPEAAATVTEEYDDWRDIKGLQLTGSVEALHGLERARAVGKYLRRFPFVRELMRAPGRSGLLDEVGVFRFTPRTIAMTDNATGVFGREVLELE